MNTRFHPISLALLLAGAFSTSAAELKLTGIVCQNGGKSALIEMGPGTPVRHILRVGDRVMGIEIKSIDEKAARVTVRDGERTVELPLDGQEGVANQTFNLKGAESRQVLELYQETSGRTVLRSPGLVASRIDLKSAAGLSPVEAEAALAGALQEKGTVVTMRFDKFAFAVPFSYVPRLDSLPRAACAPAGHDENDDGSEVKKLRRGWRAEIFPPGLIKFNEADRKQVLEIYQELSGRTILSSPDLPNAKVSVRTQTELSKAEALWVMETLFRLGGITLIPEGKFVFVLRTTREPGLPIIPSNAALVPHREEPVESATLKFIDTPGEQVLQTYAKLIGREAVSKNVPSCRFTLRIQAPLNSGEAIYALDAAAALNHVRFVANDKQVRLVPAARLLKDAAP